MYCKKCGHNNPKSSVYCSRCGEVLDKEDSCREETTTGLPVLEADVEDETEIAQDLEPTEPLEKGSAILVIKRGPDAGMRFTIKRDDIVIGRHPESDIFLDDITVSRRHAVIKRRENEFIIEDTGSLNGTYLNRERIESSHLRNGDEIQIGKYRLLFFSATD